MFTVVIDDDFGWGADLQGDGARVASELVLSVAGVGAGVRTLHTGDVKLAGGHLRVGTLTVSACNQAPRQWGGQTLLSAVFLEVLDRLLRGTH